MRWTWMTMVVVAGAVLAIGCPRDREPESKPDSKPETKPEPKPRAAARTCDTRFAIVETKAAACEANKGNWKIVPRRESSPNLPGAKKRAAIAATEPRRAAPGDDQPICVYEWSGKDRPPADAFAGMTPECAVAVSMAGPTEAPEKRPGKKPEEFFFENFERQVKAFASPAVEKTWETVRKAGRGAPVVAVLDASPFGVTKPDVTGHGYAMSRVIGHLACVGGADGPDCPKVVRPYVALPRIYKDGQWVVGPDGGFIGFFHDLFDAFADALEDRPDDGRLIMNLSLGWDPTLTQPDGPEVRKMRTLLERAYCEGVLVIASAGNGPPTGQGAVYPAALESTTRLPDADRCRKLGIAKPKLPTPDKRGYRPLIHAVGSVDLYDERLPTMRAWAQSRIATFGLGVRVPGPTKGDFLPPTSGTSVSAANASALAANVWGIKAGLDASGVMAALYQGGYLLETKNAQSRTEVCLDTADDRCHSWPTRRATLCGAVNAALGAKKLECISIKEAHPDPDAEATAKEHFPPEPTGPRKPPVLERQCSTTSCGVPIGSSPDQVFAAVGPNGVPTCASCLLRKNAGNGWVEGDMSFPVSPVPTFDTTVIIYDRFYAAHYYAPFNPSNPLGGFVQNLPEGSTRGIIGGEINFSYEFGGVPVTVRQTLQIVP